MNRIIISSSNFFDDELPEYRDSIAKRYELKSDGGCAYIETEDTIGDVVQFFIDNVHSRIIVEKNEELGLCITIYDGYIE